jgi:hypothetical protein
VSSDFEVDVQALKAFADAIRGKIIGNGSGAVAGMVVDDKVKTYLKAVAPPSGNAGNFGEMHPDFTAASKLSDSYTPNYRGWIGNFQALLNLLETLAVAAETLAANYQSAGDYDQVSAQSVDDAYDNAKVTPVPLPTDTPSPATPGTTTTTTSTTQQS